MKNSVNVSMKVSMKILRLLDTTPHVKIRQDDIKRSTRSIINSTAISKISIFPRTAGDMIQLRYIDIEPIFRYFRYIEASLSVRFAIVLGCQVFRTRRIRICPTHRQHRIRTCHTMHQHHRTTVVPYGTYNT